jgi:hypothetical protein
MAIRKDRKPETPGVLTSVPTGAIVSVVAIGNPLASDATGVKGDRGKPFLTMAGANVLSIPGDFVYVEGTPDERDVFIDGVTYIIDGDFRYTGVDPGGLIDDTAGTGQNGKLVVNIFVNGVFNNENAAAVTVRIVNCSNVASIVNIQCVSGDVTQLSGEWGIDLSGGAKLNFKGLLKTEFFVYEANTVMNLFGDSQCDNSTTFNDVEDFATVNAFGNITSTVHKSIEVFTDGFLFCSGDLVQDSPAAAAIEGASFTGGTARVEGRVIAKGANTLFAANFENIFGSIKVELLGGIETDFGVCAFVEDNSVNVYLHKRLQNNWANAGGHGIQFDSILTQKVVTQNVVIVLTHAAALSIDGNGNLTNVAVNNTIPNSNRAVSAGLVQQVNSLNHDTNVV